MLNMALDTDLALDRCKLSSGEIPAFLGSPWQLFNITLMVIFRTLAQRTTVDAMIVTGV